MAPDPAPRAAKPRVASPSLWSGRRESNPRPRAWKARALPPELLPRLEWRGEDSNLRRHTPADLQSAPFGHLGTSPHMASRRASRWSESNRRPADYKSAALPLSYIGGPRRVDSPRAPRPPPSPGTPPRRLRARASPTPPALGGGGIPP